MPKTKEKSGKAKGRQGGGLTVKSFGGLNKGRFNKKGSSVNRIKFNDNKVHPVQFVGNPNDEGAFLEIDQHQFQDDGWKYVPCLGDGCPLCEDEDGEVSKVHYRFFTNVYDFKEKKFCVMEGPKTLAAGIGRKFERAEKKKKGSFLKKTYEITQIKGTPVTYEIEMGDERPVTVDPKKLVDLNEYVEQQARYYYGDDMPTGKKSKKGKGKEKTALDDDDADSDEFSKKELKKMSEKDLLKAAKVVGVKKAKDIEDRDDLIKQILKAQAA